jgi:hypothetical protein
MKRQRRRLTEFGKLRRKLFITRRQAAQFEVTERTINNWDYRKTPAWALRMLQRQDRSLSGLHPDWAGFKIRMGRRAVRSTPA